MSGFQYIFAHGEISAKLNNVPDVRAAIAQRFPEEASAVLFSSSYKAIPTKIWLNGETLFYKRQRRTQAHSTRLDYKKTSPQLLVNINRDRVADLGVSISDIGGTLEVMLGQRKCQHSLIGAKNTMSSWKV